MSDYTLDEIKDLVSIEDVLLECGATIDQRNYHGETSIYCPFHLNQRTSAASFNAMKGVFYCHACDAGGSVIDAALLYLQTDKVAEAKEWLEDTFLD
jgi:DNA primase